MKRITISLSDAALERLTRMAAAERRSRSAQLAVLIESINKPTPRRKKKGVAA